MSNNGSDRRVQYASEDTDDSGIVEIDSTEICEDICYKFASINIEDETKRTRSQDDGKNAVDDERSMREQFATHTDRRFSEIMDMLDKLVNEPVDEGEDKTDGFPTKRLRLQDDDENAVAVNDETSIYKVMVKFPNDSEDYRNEFLKECDRLRDERRKTEGEKAEGEKAEGEKAEGEKAEGEKADCKKADHEKADRKRAVRRKANRKKAEREKAEREKVEREKAEREKAEREKTEREKAEREKAEREKAEREKAEREKADRDNADRKKVDRKRAIRRKADREKADREKAVADRSGKRISLANVFDAKRTKSEVVPTVEAYRSEELEQKCYRNEIENIWKDFERYYNDQILMPLFYNFLDDVDYKEQTEQDALEETRKSCTQRIEMIWNNLELWLEKCEHKESEPISKDDTFKINRFHPYK